jgi:hypothetical protein
VTAVTTQDIPTREKFLKEDFYNSLRWLFEGAIAWEASFGKPERIRHQRVLGMFASLVQARALYEFFYSTSGSDDARASHFATNWEPDETELYAKYMAQRMPANKRIFHLVYNRSIHAGGRDEEKERLEDKVLLIAIDLHQLCEQFAANADSDFRNNVRYALDKALGEAKKAVEQYGIANPL